MYNIDRTVKTFILTSVAVSLAVWNVAFNLGAFGTIFFDRLFVVWIASLAVLLACLFLPKEKRPLSGWGLFVLATPTFWVILAIFEQLREEWTWLDVVTLYASTAVVLLCLPYVGYVLISITQSEALSIQPRRLLFSLIGIAVLVGILGYLMGVNNWLLLSCYDFKVSGNDLPPGCWQGEAWR